MHLNNGDKHYRVKIVPVVAALLLLVGIVTAFVIGVSAKEAAEKVEAMSVSSVPTIQPSSHVPDKVVIPPPVSSAPSSSKTAEASSMPTSSEDKGIKKSSSSDVPKKASSITQSSEKTSSAEPAPVKEVSSEPPQIVDGELPQGAVSDWNLILLNYGENNKIDKELDIKKVKFDSQYVDERASDAYKNMYAAAKTANITLFLRSGYRSIKTQQVNYNANVQRELKRGNNQEEAIRLTNQYYTVPGHSEHHTGLAFDLLTPEYHKDIYTLDERFAKTDAYSWLVANCAEYGFILRYPKDKTEVTSINFEPWHYRYVGVEHAKYIMANSLCLEEYISLLTEQEVTQ